MSYVRRDRPPCRVCRGEVSLKRLHATLCAPCRKSEASRAAKSRGRVAKVCVGCKVKYPATPRQRYCTPQCGARTRASAKK